MIINELWNCICASFRKKNSLESDLIVELQIVHESKKISQKDSKNNSDGTQQKLSFIIIAKLLTWMQFPTSRNIINRNKSKNYFWEWWTIRSLIWKKVNQSVKRLLVFYPFISFFCSSYSKNWGQAMRHFPQLSISFDCPFVSLFFHPLSSFFLTPNSKSITFRRLTAAT